MEKANVPPPCSDNGNTCKSRPENSGPETNILQYCFKYIQNLYYSFSLSLGSQFGGDALNKR